jgi:5-deoxy-D-glucuronate isomerase
LDQRAAYAVCAVSTEVITNFIPTDHPQATELSVVPVLTPQPKAGM